MKKFKIRAVSITALLLAAGVLLTGCPQKVKEEPKYTVTIDGTPNGTVTAGSDISQPVYKGTVINFTAEPASGYGVGKWTITGGVIVSGGKSLDKCNGAQKMTKFCI
ncbi:InlB B-repeat-containing protein [Treponema putidum]|uniref:InlB B-repeat-containing protein n=1 Tax=Treponema putidum TaxID=221027 RepID=UPI002103D7BF|nr:hypothetical protein [Treponema putidum]